MGLIVRTAGVGKSAEALQWDLSFRLKHWEAIQKAAESRPAPFLIHQESNVIVRAFRDYLRQDIGEILIDNPKVLELARQHIAALGRPDFSSKIKLYTGEIRCSAIIKSNRRLSPPSSAKCACLPAGQSLSTAPKR
jgi:ribonuclease E